MKLVSFAKELHYAATMRLVAIVVIVLSLACAGDSGDHVLEITFDPCAPLRIEPAADVRHEEHRSIDAAIALWRDVLGVAAEQAESADAGVPVIAIRFERAAPAFRGIYLDEIGEVVINRVLEDDRVRTIAIAHELGHAFGLWHVDPQDHSSVMIAGNIEIAPTTDDAAALAAAWPSCPAR